MELSKLISNTHSQSTKLEIITKREKVATETETEREREKIRKSKTRDEMKDQIRLARIRLHTFIYFMVKDRILNKHRQQKNRTHLCLSRRSFLILFINTIIK